MLEVYFFASLRERLGCDSVTIAWQGGTVSDLVAILMAREDERWRQSFSDERLLVAVNQEVASFDARLQAGDEVAFFPPVTGG